MIDAHQELKRLQQRIIERKEEIFHDTEFLRTDSEHSKLLLIEKNQLFHILFYGSVMEESFSDLITTISKPNIAVYIESLVIHEADEGANGTIELDFTELINSNAIFTNIKYFYVEPYHIRWHNHPIIGWYSEDDTMISKLIAKMPKLQALTIPNAPNSEFFKLDLSRVYSLNIYCGYESQNFILHLSHSSNLPKLKFLQFCEYNERYMAEYPQGCVRYEHYVELFKSEAFSTVSRFILRYSILSEYQIEKLKQICKPSKYNSFDVPSDERSPQQQHLVFDFPCKERQV